MLLYIKKADLSLAALGFSYFVCSCMQSILLNPDAFRCQKAELSLAALGFSYGVCSGMPSISFLAAAVAVDSRLTHVSPSGLGLSFFFCYCCCDL